MEMESQGPGFQVDDPHENAGPGIFLCRKHAGQMAEIFAAPDDDEVRGAGGGRGGAARTAAAAVSFRHVYVARHQQ